MIPRHYYDNIIRAFKFKCIQAIVEFEQLLFVDCTVDCRSGSRSTPRRYAHTYTYAEYCKKIFIPKLLGRFQLSTLTIQFLMKPDKNTG